MFRYDTEAEARAAVRESEPGWHWRNCRSVGVIVSFWPLDWSIGVTHRADLYGGETHLSIGPLNIGLAYNIGNCSSYGPERRWALSEAQAYDRAVRFEAGR